MYAGALNAGMDPGTFWASSPRAVLLVIRQARKLRGGGMPRRPGAKKEPQRVRLNRLPHP